MSARRPSWLEVRGGHPLPAELTALIVRFVREHKVEVVRQVREFGPCEPVYALFNPRRPRLMAGQCNSVSAALADFLDNYGYKARAAPAWAPDSIPAELARALGPHDSLVIRGQRVYSMHAQTLVEAYDDSDGDLYLWRIDLTATQYRNILGWRLPWAERIRRVY